jgi:hypothetical protein
VNPEGTSVTTSANARIRLRTVSRRKKRRSGEIWFARTFNPHPHGDYEKRAYGQCVRVRN